MKLTNTIRYAFIRAAMNDVPSVDYAEQIRAIALADIADQLPKKVRAVWDDTSLRHWVKTDWRNYGGVSMSVPCGDLEKPLLRVEAGLKINALKKAADTQHNQRQELERKLKGCAYSVTTRKALVALLPEFEKYLPADEPAALRTLPVVANVVADFVKAGWPKGGKNEAVAG
jgi:hypothetical protein